MKIRKKAKVNSRLCVACGQCAKICPMAAITIERGICAVVEKQKCVGCGKCAVACPASVIRMEEETA